LPHPLCDLCGTPVNDVRSRCTSCAKTPLLFRQLRSWSAFDEPIRPALHRLKYRHDIGLAEALVPQLAGFASDLDWRPDLVIPVPLGRARLAERGYNQARLISWPLSLALGIAHVPSAMSRTRETRSQVGLSRAERRQNVRGAFGADETVVDGRVVLVVDDVATTGATLSACAAALHEAGANDVFALTVARAHRGPAKDT
jgi:competence protein ComFC